MPRGRERWQRGWSPGSGGRPPWWPENEPFPPRGRPGPQVWRAMRRRFVWWIVAWLTVVVGMLVLFAFLLADLVNRLSTGQPLGALNVLAAMVWTALLLVGALAVRRMLRRTAAPVADLIEAAGRVEAGDFGVRVPERGPRQVRSLAAAFNAMSARLEATEEQRRRLLADVSHELRTPLTVIQGNLEGVLDGLYPADASHLAPILDETRVLSRLVDDLRTLASAEAGNLALHAEPTDVEALLGDVAASFRSQADAAGVTIEIRAAADLPPLELDRERMRQVVANLVVNALRHTGVGGRIDVEARPVDDAVEVVVRDSGSGMAPEVLERIFERFYRSPDSRGSGLGLPIARELVRSHGGEITARSAPGEGTSVVVRLPWPTRDVEA